MLCCGGECPLFVQATGYFRATRKRKDERPKTEDHTQNKNMTKKKNGSNGAKGIRQTEAGLHDLAPRWERRERGRERKNGTWLYTAQTGE